MDDHDDYSDWKAIVFLLGNMSFQKRPVADVGPGSAQLPRILSGRICHLEIYLHVDIVFSIHPIFHDYLIIGL